MSRFIIIIIRSGQLVLTFVLNRQVHSTVPIVCFEWYIYVTEYFYIFRDDEYYIYLLFIVCLIMLRFIAQHFVSVLTFIRQMCHWISSFIVLCQMCPYECIKLLSLFETIHCLIILLLLSCARSDLIIVKCLFVCVSQVSMYIIYTCVYDRIIYDDSSIIVVPFNLMLFYLVFN